MEGPANDACKSFWSKTSISEITFIFNMDERLIAAFDAKFSSDMKAEATCSFIGLMVGATGIEPVTPPV